MLTISFAFAIICFALLLLFFSGLPNLRSCELPTSSRKNEPDRQNRLAVMMVTLVYALCAFWNLGNTRSPQSFAPMESRAAVLALPESSLPTQLILFPGVGQGSFSIEYSEDTEGWFPLTTFTQDHVAVLKWQFLPLELPYSVRFLRLNCTSGSPWLGEIALRDATGEMIGAGCSVPELVDEAYLIPKVSDFHNSSYFDEIYHARTAWEHLHGVWPYEVSHPPLGKEILSLGILIFGMTPFGWRFSGTMTGVLMLPLMNVFLKRMFGSGRVPLFGTILLASGFMHYVQTRIATIDCYAVFFILLMYTFMYGWLQEGKLRDLGLCGISFGLGAACKWICLYAGAGLALLWFGHWILEFLDAKDNAQSARTDDQSTECIVQGAGIDQQDWSDAEEPASRSEGQARKKPISAFLLNILFCIVFFLLIPGLIYYLSYLPYGISQHAPVFSRAYTKIVLDNQSFMFSYHANIVAEHPYSSRWYQWILNIRPILYYLEYFPDGTRISFGAFVNPMICWGGLLSLPVLLYMTIARRDRAAAFLLVAYVSGLVPWMFISRLTFEYHYFASALFLVPSICYLFALMERAASWRTCYAVGFTAVSVLLFIWFFPALNGIVVRNDLATKLMGWLPSWPF